jgi:hypothetical protein
MPTLARTTIAIAPLLALMLFGTIIGARAAEMELNQQRQAVGIYINGEIIAGDFNKFKPLAAKLPANSFVLLDSPGGLIVEALQIGEMVRAKKFRTIALELCASACALIWVAGVQQGSYAESRVGFHSAYNATTKQISGSANALVGAYLSKLGYSYSVIHYMTKVGPESMEWLTDEQSRKLGIKIHSVTGCFPKRDRSPLSDETLPVYVPKYMPPTKYCES